MGKKFFGVIAFAAIAAVAGWNYQQNKNEVQLTLTFFLQIRFIHK